MGPTPHDDHIHRVTIYEVARRAGVSIATVSHALNRPDRVAATTRARVLAAVDALGFIPKSTAVGQSRRGVGRVGVVAPFSAAGVHSARLVGVLEAVAHRPVEVIVVNTPPDSGAGLVRSLPTTGRLDALLVLGVPLDDETVERVIDAAVPTVLIGVEHKELNTVTVDEETAGFLIGEHLTRRGHQSFAYLSVSGDEAGAGELRAEGFLRALIDADVSDDSARWLTVGPGADGGREAVHRLLDRGLPTAVAAATDATAAGVLHALAAAGRQVPDDVAVTGFGGTQLADALAMTTVRLPDAEMGQIAASLVLSMLEGATRSVQHITLAPELVVRASG